MTALRMHRLSEEDQFCRSVLATGALELVLPRPLHVVENE
jgi:hypothetical protein